MTITGTWHKALEAEVLQRSSQIVSVVDGNAYIFGGELRPREPRDNDVHVVSFRGDATLSTEQASQSPSARVGAASATLNGKIYLFSGRDGAEAAPLNEAGSLWEFDPATGTWTQVSPSDSTGGYPASRSYHCMTSDGVDKIYLHAGCLEQGRGGDLWAFDLPTKKWTELSTAPGSPRGGTSITFTNGKLYRMNGFNGKTEEGGVLDIFSPETNTWSSHEFAADGKSGPTPRSVAALLPVFVSGKTYLATLFGERDPSSLGHQGAGKMLRDVWVFDIEAEMWEEVQVNGGVPDARGWFDADVLGDDTVVVQGGLGEDNERLRDVWSLKLSF